MLFYFTCFRCSVRATNTIWPPLFNASAENTASLPPSFSDGPPLSWQHAMAQLLLGFSWMAVLAVWVSGLLFPSNIEPSLRTCNTQQSTEASRFACVSIWLYFVFVLICVSLSAACYLKHLLVWYQQVMCHHLCATTLVCAVYRNSFIFSFRFYFTTFISHSLYQLLWFITTTCWAEIRNLSLGLSILLHPTLLNLQSLCKM